MRKYLAYLKSSIINTLSYRGPIVVWLLGNIIAIVAIIAVWLSSSASGTIGGYTKPELITYYIATIFMQWVAGWLPFNYTVDEIKSGEIILNTLSKPISLFKSKFAQEAGWHVVSLFVGVIATIVFALFYKNYVYFDFNLLKIFLLIPTMFLSIVICFTLSLCIGLTAFWFTEVGALDILFWTGRNLLGGQSIPISFIPQTYQPIIKALPFRYMFSFPLEVYFGKVQGYELVFGIGMQILWSIVLIFAYRILFNRGRKAYTSFGQ